MPQAETGDPGERRRRPSACRSAATFYDVRRYDMVLRDPAGRPAGQHHGHRRRGAGAAEHSGAGARRRAGRRRVVHLAHADLHQPRRRGRHHPGARLQPRRHADAAQDRPPRGCRWRSCSRAPVSAIATAPRSACRRWRSSRAASPTPASWRCDTTSAATDRAAAAPNPPRSPTMPKTCGRWSSGWRRARTWTRKRIAIIGHTEGAWVGMLAATREGKIAALVTLAGAGNDRRRTDPRAAADGARHDRTLTPADRESRVALQKQIHAAVLTGKGWEGIPPACASRPTRRGSRAS